MPDEKSAQTNDGHSGLGAAVEQKLKALEAFKDWSNYLLVTTVAALGWVSTKEAPELCPEWIRTWCIVSLALSVFFSILTLALIPHVAELIDGKLSIYDVFWDGWHYKFEIFHFCFPAHVLFLVGVLLYACGTTTHHAPKSSDIRVEIVNNSNASIPAK